jgi:alanine racemase
MTPSRRDLLLGSAAALIGAGAGRPEAAPPAPAAVPPDRFEPWIEIDPAAITHNIRAVARAVNERPILAVVKNNAYGLGLEQVGPLLDRAAEVSGLAVVKPDEAFALRRIGIRKPILLMARTTEADAVEATRLGIRLALAHDDAPAFCRAVARRAGRPVRGHLYLDTGMGRMGLPIERARAWAEQLARGGGGGGGGGVRIEGTFTELTEDREFDREQVERLVSFATWARDQGIAAGPLHAASSRAVMLQPEAHLDLVRPGFALYGGYAAPEARERGGLQPAFRLRARVARLERVEAGDGVSYHRRWRATRPTWVALLPVGHVDGYPAGAVKGCEVLIGERLYRVIGTVSASHTILEIGDEATVQVGDVATLIGPDDPAIGPATVAARAEYSDYGLFFHLNPLLPRVVRAAGSPPSEL